MKRAFALLVVGLFVILAGPASAQEGTPAPPDSFELAPGVIADSTVFLEGQESPAFYRLHFDAGVVYPIEPGINLELVQVEAGNLILTLDAPITVAELGEINSAGETVPAGTEVTLTAGQFFVLQPGVAGEVRNDGQEIATVSVAGLSPAGATLMPEATPAG